ncbi:putative gram-negative bacteria binding protein [Microdochium trichocladiopsis]|uniref:Gram-negative bacteria binding protein n=1 Tax=Microdochium trichocladiopsis TaxID=1682393 RepID=A0A9P9BNP5_9PEZI|nr:putative gram-negative bacteria binding protein [Microdochium trichocladiopsis]KAH7031441.1 putative gram-negative bacteria binding protein [Microdochium trichocladiopsis]
MKKHAFLSRDPASAHRSWQGSRPASFGGASSYASSVFEKDFAARKGVSEKPVEKPRKRFRSSKLTGDYEKPWLKNKDPREKLDKVFFYGLSLIGAGIGAYICWDRWNSVGNQNYCLAWEDDFSGGINKDSWNYEVQIDGFGTGSFDWTTTDPRNAYTDANGLHIVPTLTTEDIGISNNQLIHGYTLNLTSGGGDGTCTGTSNSACSIASNYTLNSVIPPIRSARLNTKGKHMLRYGKVEVTAKLPAGDWLWPAIWMMPQDNAYGDWPASGEIDIMEARGNSQYVFRNGGRDTVSGVLHWGPTAELDRFVETSNGLYMRRKDFTQDYHTFGLEWTKDFIFTYYDNVLKQTLYVPFGSKLGDMYSRGRYAQIANPNGYGAPNNPWSSSSNPNAPFDQAFYLILNVAVGGTNGFFPDGYAGKPWVDKLNNSASAFWNASSAWKPTWGDADSRGMTVKSVKMWNTC